MKIILLHAAVVCVAIAASGCGKETPAPEGSDSATAARARGMPEVKVPPYAYPAPVRGHIKELNIGEFDLVDGVAYPSMNGGTVMYVVSRPIASPMLVESACPLTQARALSLLRNASFSEVTLDAAGRSTYFSAGKALGGGLTDLAPRDWSSTLKTDARRAVGSVVHHQYGRYEFDLPLSNPKIDQISEGDRQQKRRLAATTPKPTGQAVIDAYVALRDAALRKDLKATLLALGFDAKQTAAIRGMEGIDADFQDFADRFLKPGTPGDPWTKPGSGQVRGEGVKVSGKKFFNDYYFDACGGRLVLTGMVEQSP